MSKEHEQLIRNANSNDEIRKLCQTDKSLETAGLAESLDQPKKLMEKVFTSLSLKEKDFNTFKAASKKLLRINRRVQ